MTASIKLPPQLLSYQDVARLLGIQPWTVRQMVRDGRLTPIRFSEQIVRFDPAEIAAFIDQHRNVKPTKPGRPKVKR